IHLYVSILISTHLLTTQLSYFFFHQSAHHPYLHSFPTRRSSDLGVISVLRAVVAHSANRLAHQFVIIHVCGRGDLSGYHDRTRRSEEHTSELQSRGHLVCRLLLEKKKF